MADEMVVVYERDAEVVEAKAGARTVADEARELQVVDDASNTLALDMLSQARKYVHRLDDLKKRWLDPLNEQVKLIRRDFDEMAAPAKDADAVLTDKTRAYRFKVTEEARKAREVAEAQERAYREAQAAKARLEEEIGPMAAAFLPDVEAPPAQTVEAPAKTVATEAGSKVTYRKQVHCEVVDPEAVPREWCVPDEKRLGAAARSGVITERNCPAGVRVWTTEEPVVL